MGIADARGTKRTCQNDDCGTRFYDLNRNPIVCPICETAYIIAHAPAGAVFVEDVKPKEAKRPKPEVEEVVAEDGELADIEADDAIPDDDDENDDTFLEDEEDDEGNVVDIIPGIADGEPEEA